MVSFPRSTSTEVDITFVTSAKKAFGPWSRLSRVKRAEYLLKVATIIERRKEELAQAISLETGKNLQRVYCRSQRSFTYGSVCVFVRGECHMEKQLPPKFLKKTPTCCENRKGLVAIISPWNFPLAIGAYWCAAPALVEGNTVILKPSEDAPLSSQIAAEIYHEAGIPAGVFNLHSWVMEKRGVLCLHKSDNVDHHLLLLEAQR